LSKIEGKQRQYRGAKVGEVILKFDINENGRTENIKAVRANNICFEAPAIKSVSQWVYTSGAPQKGVENMIRFRLIESPNGTPSLEDDIQDFVNP